jgi:hypothetical protein
VRLIGKVAVRLFFLMGHEGWGGIGEMGGSGMDGGPAATVMQCGRMTA